MHDGLASRLLMITRSCGCGEAAVSRKQFESVWVDWLCELYEKISVKKREQNTPTAAAPAVSETEALD